MLQLDRNALAARLPWPDLVEALAAMFREGCAAPLRHRHDLPGGGSLLLMPAVGQGHSGVKIVHVAPGNAALGLPAVHAEYLLSDATTGVPVALLDGGELTDRRTAAASVLAARHLARSDSRCHLVLGAGKVAAALAEAFHAEYGMARTSIWARRPAQAQALAARLAAHGVPAVAVPTPEPAGHDIISAATLASTPLILGASLAPGMHLDLVGAYRPDMREADGPALARALCVVDTRAGALAEAGDIVQAVAEGHISLSHVAAELAELCRGTHPGRTGPDQITLFKSVGWAGEDLAAAVLATRGAAPGRPNGGR